MNFGVMGTQENLIPLRYSTGYGLIGARNAVRKPSYASCLLENWGWYRSGSRRRQGSDSFPLRDCPAIVGLSLRKRPIIGVGCILRSIAAVILLLSSRAQREIFPILSGPDKKDFSGSLS
jgi:hypothetical protein